MFSIIFILGLILCGQLITQLYAVKQLNKVAGKIATTDVQATSYSGVGRWRKGKPNYSYILTLENGKSYDIDLNSKNWVIENSLKKGDYVTIYYPTVAYDILSLNILEFGTKASQVELGHQIIYGFSEQKKDAWPFIGLMVAGLLVALYRLYGLYHGG